MNKEDVTIERLSYCNLYRVSTDDETMICTLKEIWRMKLIDFGDYMANKFRARSHGASEIFNRWMRRTKIASHEKLERFSRRFHDKHEYHGFERFDVPASVYGLVWNTSRNRYVSLDEYGVAYEFDKQDLTTILKEITKHEHRRIARNTGGRVTKISFR